jgi:hypothetical protein
MNISTTSGMETRNDGNWRPIQIANVLGAGGV